ncbi:hypothetical protein CBP51_09130 [Cellvibrio mixtus]|uniref:Right handed beta helix domain-containing protein n=1 Tax=Cellvibrio mixtus TaxID=39650 RepID=A0A266QCQ9_9GAMM|nr:right-handed parallel beta-helix repeat-containing protein [Cellvibrio mixtus]OZY87131.1 hypothetical protein CBP51_09130 [Cellvibrio mixtus]
MKILSKYMSVFLTTLSIPTIACTVTLSSYGAVGNGITNDTESIIRAFNTSCPDSSEHKIIDGENKTYAVYGTLRVADSLNATLKNIRLKQTKSGDGGTRTIFKTHGMLNLNNIYVDRGSDVYTGSPLDSAGIWLQVENSEFYNVEVTGNGTGNGFFVVGSKNILMDKIYVHDMRWATYSPPQYEMLTGISILNSENVTLINSRVEKIFGNLGNGIYTRFQSDGITVGGTKGVKIINTVVEQTGEGIDFTGSAGNSEFEVLNTTIFDAHSFGFKFANTASNGSIRGSAAYRSGYAGFVVSGLHGGGNLPISIYETQNILIENCRAINTGHDTDWQQGQIIAGFKIMSGHSTNVLPRNIQIRNSIAQNDAEHAGKMRYGFQSETKGNTVFNVQSTGHSASAITGFTAALQ